jgi:hypothetical protein
MLLTGKEIKLINLRFEFLTVGEIPIVVARVLMLCGLVGSYQL